MLKPRATIIFTLIALTAPIMSGCSQSVSNFQKGISNQYKIFNFKEGTLNPKRITDSSSIPSINIEQENREEYLTKREIYLAKEKERYHYYDRGVEEFELEDYQNAIINFTEVIRMDGNQSPSRDSYGYRASAKYHLGDYQGAINDYTKAISMSGRYNPDSAIDFKGRGLAKKALNDLASACTDWRQASRLGDWEANQWVKNQCD